ncbi:MAG: hypothetical protein RBR65_01215 [Aliarcobacter sp.]|jgi:hypothetical protein|nr:hypothetical protein [Aliarcobacter sp.]
MSGSSSNERSFSGEIGDHIENPIQDCTSIGGNTNVISPTMVYFGTAAIGDVLNVELDGSTLAVVNSLGDTVGGIYPAWAMKLIDCINSGNKYVAIITKMNGAAITVSIQKVS